MHTAVDISACWFETLMWRGLCIHRARPHGLELLAGRPLRTAGLWVL